MTNTMDIFGKSRHGGKYTIAEEVPVGEALKMVNLLNRDCKDDFFHHFYASRIDVGAPMVTLMPGEGARTVESFVDWLIVMGVVVDNRRGNYQIGSERVRGRVAVAERFGQRDDDGRWSVSRLIYRTPVI